MKKLFKLTFIAIIGLAIGLSSCGKYPDGPKISLLTKKARITRVWQAADCPTCGTTEYVKNGSIVIAGGSISITTGSTWAFSKDKTKLEITSGAITSSTPIRRLTNKELWLEGSSSAVINKYIAK